MYRTEDVLATLRMVQREHLDVRTITLGINLQDCAAPGIDDLCARVGSKIRRLAGPLPDACTVVARRYGIPIIHRRCAISPVASFAQGHTAEGLIRLARTLDTAAVEAGVDLIGGFTALVHKGFTPGDRTLIDTLPEVLATTERVCGSVTLASSRAGINMDAVLRIGQVLKDIAARTADRDGFGCAKLVVFANAPEDNPFMAGAFLGAGEPECVVNIGVSGPGVVKHAVERLLQTPGVWTLGDVAEEIKSTAFRVTRVGELIGREVAAVLGVDFGIVDLSLAPTPQVGDSVGEILQAMGIAAIGGPGSTAALALLNDAVKKGGSFASSSVGGLSGAFIPVCEDNAFAEAVARGSLSLEKLEAMTSVCSVGLDMVAVPGDTDAETLAAIIADEMAIGVINTKTTAVRIIPVPGKSAGDHVVFGGLFGQSAILPIRAGGQSGDFVRRGGRIPAPLNSLRN